MRSLFVVAVISAGAIFCAWVGVWALKFQRGPSA